MKSKITYIKPKRVETRIVLGEHNTSEIVINLDHVCAFYWLENGYTKVILNGGVITIECNYWDFSLLFDEYMKTC